MTATATNRAQRRQLARASRRAPKRQPRNPLAALAPLVVLENARPYEPGEQAGEHLMTRASFERLVDGSADTDDFDRVAMVINMVKVRAIEIDATLADMLERAQDAMGRCKTRYYSHGRFGFDGQGLELMREAIGAAEAIIDASSPLQMRTARDVVADQLLGKGAAARMKAHALSSPAAKLSGAMKG